MKYWIACYNNTSKYKALRISQSEIINWAMISCTLTLSTMGMRVGHVSTVQGQICPRPCLIGLRTTMIANSTFV